MRLPDTVEAVVVDGLLDETEPAWTRPETAALLADETLRTRAGRATRAGRDGVTP